MKNYARELRRALEMTQVQFADLIGKSYASVQSYEAGKRIPADVLHDMQSIASERGINLDVAGEREEHPVATLSTSNQMKHEKWVGMLEAILDSGHSQAIRAVTENLVAFHRLITVDKERPKKRVGT